MNNPYEVTGQLVNDIRPQAQRLFEGAMHFGQSGHHEMPTTIYTTVKEHGPKLLDAVRALMR